MTVGFLDDIFGSNQTTDTSYNKNTQQNFTGQSNQNQSYNPYGALYSQYALQQGQPGILGAQGVAQPYYGQAGNYFGQSAAMPDVASFYNPFASNVMANMEDVFGQQMKQTTGNAIQMAGGAGAGRIGVVQANLAKQQALAAGQTMAGIYGQAQQAAAQQRAQQYQVGQGYAGLGTAAQTAYLQPWMALGQYTQGLTPGLGAGQTGQTNQSGQMTGTESGTGHSETESDPSTWSDLMNIGSFASKIIAPRPGARGGRMNPYARGGEVSFGRHGAINNEYHRPVMQGVRSLGLHDPRHYMRGGPSYADGGEVEYEDNNQWTPELNDRFNAAGDAFPGEDPTSPLYQMPSEWNAERKVPGDLMSFASEPRPASADVPLRGESPPMVPWRPAPREGEGNPYAMAQRKPDRSSIPGLLESMGIIGPEASDTLGRFGDRLGEASLAGQGVQGAAAAAKLPLERRSLDQQEMSIAMRARQLQAEAERHAQEFAEHARHNRATEDLGAGRLEQENWQHLGPTEDGSGSIFLNRKSGETKTIPLQIAGKTKPIPAGLQKDLGTQAGSYHTLSSLESGFKDDYGGSTFSKVGDIQNWIARNTNIGNTDAADWWQEYQRYKNGVRHGLFGSALTANEISEWEKSDITPGMTPERIRANVKHQREVVEGALQRRALSLSKQGYSKEAIEAEMGMKIGAPAAPGGDRSPPAGEKKVPRTVKQNGWIFQEQPDGSMKPLQQVGP